MLRKCLQILVMVLEGYRRHQCNWLASALTFFTLLAIVPVLALVFTLTDTFLEIDQITPWIEDQIEGSKALQQVVDWVFDAAGRTDLAALGGLGVLLLLFLVLKTIGTIEQSFNRIWEVKKARGWLRKSTDYLSFVIIGPLFIFGIAGMTRFQYTAVDSIAFQVPGMAWLGTIRGSQIAGLAIVWMAFFFAYLLLPNKRVKLGPAMFAAFVAATAWELAIKGYVALQIGVGQSAALYGAFAAIPIFLVWVQVNWLIVLAGAELAAAIEKRAEYGDAVIAGDVPPRGQAALALHVLAWAADRFDRGLPAPTISECRARFVTSTQLLVSIVEALASRGILRRSAEDDACIVLSNRPDRIPVHDITTTFDPRGDDPSWNMLGDDAIAPPIDDLMQRLEQAERVALASTSLGDLSEAMYGGSDPSDKDHHDHAAPADTGASSTATGTNESTGEIREEPT